MEAIEIGKYYFEIFLIHKMHNILSIDLGIKNLGYTVIGYSKMGPKKLEDLKILELDIFNIESQFQKKVDIVNNRCNAICSFFTMLKDKYTKFDYVIIERQVNRNTMAMELMYACAMCCKTLLGVDFINFDPKDKFTKLGIEYSTANKQHKKQSINMAQTLIKQLWQDLEAKFNTHNKKDDMADALNQCLVWMLINNLLSYTIDEYCMLLFEHTQN